MKTIKQIKAEYSARIAELRAERDATIQEARAARKEKREQHLDQPMLNNQPILETFEERAERVMTEVNQLVREHLSIEKAQEKNLVVSAFAIDHPEYDVASIIDEFQEVGRSWNNEELIYLVERDGIQITEAERNAIFHAYLCEIWEEERISELHGRIRNINAEDIIEDIYDEMPNEEECRERFPRVMEAFDHVQSEFWAMQAQLREERYGV